MNNRGTGTKAAVLFFSSIIVSIALAQGPSGNPPPPQSGYIQSSQVDWVPLLSAPPAADSASQQRDLQEVLAVQAAARANPERLQQAIDDTEGYCFRFADVLGPKFDKDKLPLTAAFLDNAVEGAKAVSGVVKEAWKRPRPYVVSDQVVRMADVDPEWVKQKEAEKKAKEEEKRKKQAEKDAAAGKPVKKEPAAEPEDPEVVAKREAEDQQRKDNTSFPSGHATGGTICSILLTQMLPEKQAEIFERANTFRESRMVVGAHYRTDIENGRALGTAVAAVMSQNFAFQQDLLAARAELRQALGLPAELPKRDNEENEKSSAATM